MPIRNIERVLFKILQQEIILNLNFRGQGVSRIKINSKETNENILLSLNSLSAGQSTLLSIFANIIRSSETVNFLKSFDLKSIQGIVVIDEIDLHLHIGLQKDILPQLIKLFPKVQFIITTHSPFFLNRMAKNFNSDDYRIINMPDGNILNNYEEFEEFNKAYEVFQDLTNSHKKEKEFLEEKLKLIEKPVVITEGKTDWKHLKNALNKLKQQSFYQNLEFDFLEYDKEIEMGFKSLISMAKSFKKTKQLRKTIFIFDSDENEPLKKYGKQEFQHLGNNVYAFCIPAINELKNISIEFYYSEDELKTKDKNNLRLFLGTEFYKSGNSKNGNFQTSKKDKAEKLEIIDEKVFSIDDLEHKINLALTKNDFAENILDNIDEFKNINVSNFKLIFNVIQKIIEEKG